MEDVIGVLTSRQYAEDVNVSFHINETPEFAEKELQRLYGHLYSSLPFLKIFKTGNEISTYVAWRDTTPTAILLFRMDERRMEVLNERIQLSKEEMERFCAHAFARFQSLGVISFNAVGTDLQNFAYPVQRDVAGEDLIIDLPATPDEYTESLGKATRRNIKRYMRKMERDFGSVSFEVYEKDRIEPQVMQELLRLSKARITTMKMRYSIDDRYASCMDALAKVCGVVGLIRVDGQLCAGAITYRLGAHQTAEVIAHDPRYDDYWPGTLCYYLTIAESINKGVRRFHMGSGRYGYKQILMGVPHEQDHLEIYRSYRHMILNWEWAIKMATRMRISRLKRWLLNRNTNPVVRLLVVSAYALRTLPLRDHVSRFRQGE